MFPILIIALVIPFIKAPGESARLVPDCLGGITQFVLNLPGRIVDLLADALGGPFPAHRRTIRVFSALEGRQRFEAKESHLLCVAIGAKVGELARGFSLLVARFFRDVLNQFCNLPVYFRERLLHPRALHGGRPKLEQVDLPAQGMGFKSLSAGHRR